MPKSTTQKEASETGCPHAPDLPRDPTTPGNVERDESFIFAAT